MSTDLETQVASLPSTAKSLARITTNEEYVRAGEILLAIKDLRKQIDEVHDPAIAAAHTAHKKAIEAKKKVSDPLDAAERHLKPLIATYLTEQERKRRAEELRLKEEARKQEEETRLAEAEAAERDGHHEIASAIIDLPPTPPTVVLPPTTPKVQGISSREYWHAEVTDLRELCQAVVDGKVPMQAIQANETFLNNQARVMKDTLNYPGVRAVKSTGITAGSR